MGAGENDPAKSKESNSFSSKMYLVSLLPILCIVSAAPEGGLLGFGLLGGGDTTSSTSTSTTSPATTTALVEVLTSTTTASSSDNSGIIQNLIDVLTGKVATIALDQLSSLLGLNHPALALAMGGLAGNLVLTHIFTIATETLVSTT